MNEQQIVEPGNVAANHRFDLEYALRVLGNAQALLPKKDGAQGEIAAAIKGLQYIISRLQPSRPAAQEAASVQADANGVKRD